MKNRVLQPESAFHKSHSIRQGARRDMAKTDHTINRFRTRRGRLLRRQITDLADHLGRDIVILDVGGRPDYWANVGVEGIARIDVMNQHENEVQRRVPETIPSGIFTRHVGDARDLSNYANQSIDLVHSNSVIEHVGTWVDMRNMADELMRVGRAGWVQTPNWGFPVEPHFRAPFLHWFGQPLRARMMSLSLRADLRKLDIHRRRVRIDTINLLSRREMQALFPGKPLYVERVVLAKSFTARWMPDGLMISKTS